jgi:hypothetical protein
MTTSQPIVIMALEPQMMIEKELTTRSTTFLVIVAFTSTTQEERKQR